MGFLKQYMGLRKELYIIFWGRVVTNMGALIWPMMTLILKNKLGYSASQVAGIMMILGFVQLPCTLIGGKLADRFSKRNIIIVCDLVTVVSYFICAFLPIDRKMIPLLAVAALFAQMEWPSYDALVADLSSVNDRERAYSLNYLGLNLGLVLAPILGRLPLCRAFEPCFPHQQHRHLLLHDFDFLLYQGHHPGAGGIGQQPV